MDIADLGESKTMVVIRRHARTTCLGGEGS